ncbi:MAG: hypothetical protein VKK80_04645 [Prochlorothrix sp.]|nr:hypothetical protein [Prochlorothrix sp.]
MSQARGSIDQGCCSECLRIAGMMTGDRRPRAIEPGTSLGLLSFSLIFTV